MNNRRSYVVGICALLIGIIYAYRLVQLQVLDDKYAILAEKISLKKEIIHPQRGLIFDRNGKLLVSNEPVYDFMIRIPHKGDPVDTNLLCQFLNISKETFYEKLIKAKKSAYRQKAVFVKNVSKQIFVALQERLFEFDGFFFEVRNDRKYQYNSAAHLLGYLGEVNKEALESQSDEYYGPGDFVGKEGVEFFYENYLRGKKGIRYSYIDNLGYTKGAFADGQMDISPEDGKSLYLSIDIDLQMFGEKLLQNKMGSVVALDPKTGEVLALISSPYYNPEYFTIEKRGKYYNAVLNDPSKPLYNRAVSAPYPPGSTFKPVMSLVAMHNDIIDENFVYGCGGGYQLGARRIACHAHPYHVGIEKSIAYSCNSFYCSIFKQMMTSNKFKNTKDAYNSWYKTVQLFGIGTQLGIDISSESQGWLRSSEYYDKNLGLGQWNYGRIISVAFGQGELGLTPLQMANFTAVIANGGNYYIPHLVKSLEGIDTIPAKYRKLQRTFISPDHFEVIKSGMAQVMTGGTGYGASIPGITIAGKTGTVQNPHGKNHSAFVSFSPVESPKIVVAVVVEESGYGASWAAPIATLIIEKYLSQDSVSKKPYMIERMVNANLIPERWREKQFQKIISQMEQNGK
jgi:penicillin-binding protein 2